MNMKTYAISQTRKILLLSWLCGVLTHGSSHAAESAEEGVGLQPSHIAAWTAADRQAARERADSLREMIAAAIVTGKTNIIIPKEDYLIDEPLVFRGMENATVQGSGATFWTEKMGTVEFAQCKHVRVENLIIDRLQYPFIQGVVREIVSGGAAGGGDRIEIDLEQGSMPADSKGKIGRTLCKSARTGKYYYRPDGYAPDDQAKNEPGEWIWRTVPAKVSEQGPQMEIGDRVSMHTAVTGHAGLSVLECGDMHFTDISVYSAPGFQVKESGIRSPGGNTYKRLKIIPRPGTTRISTSTMDGFHSYNQAKGPTLIDCEIAATYDDGINIHGFMNVVLEKLSGTEVLLCSQFGRDFDIGTELSFHAAPTLKPSGSARVEAFEAVDFAEGDPKMERVHRQFKERYQLAIRRSGRWMEFYKVTLDRAVEADAMDMAISPDFSGRGTRITNLHMRDGCNRGVLIKAPDSVIESSVFENIFFGGLYITGELGATEGAFPDRVVIRNNRFIRCGYYSTPDNGNLWSSVSPITVLASLAPKIQTAYLHVAPELLFHELVIEGNLVEQSPGIAIFVANTNGASIRSNRILQEKWLYPRLDLSLGNRLESQYAPSLTAAERKSASQILYGIYVLASKNVVLAANTFEELPPEANGEIGIGPWTDGIEIIKTGKGQDGAASP